MLLTAYNLPNYILQKGNDRDFCALSSIFSANNNCLIENIDSNNPRNTLLRCTIGDQSYVFKQPKFLTNGGTWQIVNEYQFYKSFPTLQVKPQRFSFDEYYKVLLLPYLYSLTTLEEATSCSTKLEDYALKTANSLAILHQSLSLKGNPTVEIFAQNNCFNTISSYRNFLNLLQKGANHPQFLDEVVFPSFAYISTGRSILHHFLNNEDFIKSLETLSIHHDEQYLIHGDLKIENLLQEKGENILKFIDFENVSKGDNAWDFACFLESVLYQPALRRGTAPEKYQESLSKRFFFFAIYLNAYCEKFDFNENEHRYFISRVLKFLALRKLEKFRIYDGNFNYLRKSLEVIRKLMLETEFYVD